MSPTEPNGLNLTELIDVKLIHWQPVAESDRTRSTKDAERLANSIKTDGLINAIHVREDPKNKGKFIGVLGWHRYTAVALYLKWDVIKAIVIDHVSDADIQSLVIAENLFRSPLTKHQASKAIADWHKTYEARVAAYKAAKESKKKQKAKLQPLDPAPLDPEAPQDQVGPEAESAENQHAEAVSDPGETAPDGAEPEAPPANFAKDVAEKTGRSETSVKRAVKIGKAFSAEQLKVLDEEKVSQEMAETIAELPPEQRDEVMSLIASGMDPAEAITEITGKSEIKTAAGNTKDGSKSTKTERSLSDDEWITQHCSSVIEKLPERAQANFRLHALLYRATKDFRTSFAGKVQPILNDYKKLKIEFGLFAILNKMIHVDHPKNWLRCGKCEGSGMSAGKKCDDCAAQGFKITYAGSKKG